MSDINPKRSRKFRIIGVILFIIPCAALIILLTRLINSGDGKFVEDNNAINQRNYLYSKGNTFGFTDRERQATKPKGIFRIGILGDSFIWGDGLPYEKVWSHKLEKMLLENYDSLEVLHWGKNGWSTLDELIFFREHGKDFGIDLLIVGWVDNDVDMGEIPQVSPARVEQEFPKLFKLSPSLANSMLNIRQADEYDGWMDKIYGEKNLEEYQNVLNEFDSCISHNNVRTLFVMTPAPFSSREEAHFYKVKPMIIKANLDCLDLYGPTGKKLKHYSTAELQANPVNFHPGEIMTEEFAVEVKSYLIQNHYLQTVPHIRVKQ